MTCPPRSLTKPNEELAEYRRAVGEEESDDDEEDDKPISSQVLQ
jgi:hypothetical protein